MRRDRVPSAIDDDLVSECLSILDRVWPRRDASQAGDSSGSAADSNSADSDSCGADSTDRGSTECDSADAAPLESFGRFELHEARGQGGYGLVFRAYDTRLRREVALKVPRPDVLATRAMRARFLREAQAAAALDHPNIVPVLDAGEEGSLWYIVTAYCPGPTLAEWLAEHAGPVDPRIAASMVAELADGVQHAHFRGVLHRDLKPSNVLLEPVRGEIASGRLSFQPRITDFGLAKRLDDPGDETRTGVVLGTLKYMSPEQAAGRVREIGVASDVYALGVMLYEMLCGESPFSGESNVSLMRRIVEEPPRPLRHSRPALSKDLETICLKCLEKAPSERYATAADLADDLRAHLEGRPVAARPAGPIAHAARFVRRHPVAATLSAALIASIGIGMAGVSWQWRESRANLAEAQAQSELAMQRLRESEDQLVRVSLILDESHFWNDSAYNFDSDFRQRLAHDLDAAVAQTDPDRASRPARAVRAWRQAHAAYERQAWEEADRLAQQSLTEWRAVLDREPTGGVYAESASLTLYYVTLYAFMRGHEPVTWLDLPSNPILTGFAWDRPGDIRLAEDLAGLLQKRAEALRSMQNRASARSTYYASAVLWQQLSNRFPENPRYLEEKGRCYGAMGMCDLADGEFRRAALELGQAAEMLQPLVSKDRALTAARELSIRFQIAAARALDHCDERLAALSLDAAKRALGDSLPQTCEERRRHDELLASLPQGASKQ